MATTTKRRVLAATLGASALLAGACEMEVETGEEAEEQIEEMLEDD